MILTHNTDNTITSGNFNDKSMGVIADGRMFSLLLKNLYSNPAAAICRELCTNALDAHVQIGNTNPYHMQLPSRFDLTFKLRDFGPGLNAEEIDLYLNTLFSSSKTQSNQLVGGFGLGSKSSFSIVDSFNIESYKDGIKHTALWYKKECGTPVLIITGSVPSDEPSGLKFIVPCKIEHVAQFRTAVVSQLFNFSIKPKFFADIDDLTTEDTSIKFPELVEENFGVKIYNVSSDTHRLSNLCFVSMGGVVYPLNTMHASPTSVYVFNETQPRLQLLGDFNEYILKNNSRAIVFEMPIGSLTIPMSREFIEITSDNYTKLNNAFKSLQLKFIEEHFKPYFEFLKNNENNPHVVKLFFKEYLTKQKILQSGTRINLTDALKFPQTIWNTLTELYSKNITGVYKSQDITDYTHYLRYQSSVVDFKVLTKQTKFIHNIYSWLDCFSTNSLQIKTLLQSFKKSNKTYNVSFGTNKIQYNTRVNIILQDSSKDTYSAPRVEHFFNTLQTDNTGNNTYIISCEDTKLYNLVKEILQDAFELYSLENTCFLYEYSNIPKPPKKVRQVTAGCPAAPVFTDLKGIRYGTKDTSFVLIHDLYSGQHFYQKYAQTIKPISGVDFNNANYFNKKVVVLINTTYCVCLRDISEPIKKLITLTDYVFIYLTDDKYYKVLDIFKNDSSIECLLTINDNEIDSNSFAFTDKLLDYCFKTVAYDYESNWHYSSYFTTLKNNCKLTNVVFGSTYGWSGRDAIRKITLNTLEHMYLNYDFATKPLILEECLDAYILKDVPEFFRNYRQHWTGVDCKPKDRMYEIYYEAIKDYVLKKYNHELKNHSDIFTDYIVNKELFLNNFKLYMEDIDKKSMLFKKILTKLNVKTWE